MEPTESQTGADDAESNASLNERGNLPATIGEEHQAFNQANGAIAGTFTVSSIAPGECAQDTGFEIPEPQNGGSLVFVTMESKAAADGADNPLYANSGGGVISFIQEDGTTWNGDDVRATGCVPSDETIGALVDPGESVKGVMVLDVPATAVTLVFKPTLGQGYEYALP